MSVASALAQEYKEVPLLLSTTNSAWLQDTVDNTEVRIVRTPKTPGYWNLAAVTATATKISGTVAGVIRLVGSYDGTNWVRVNPTDSLIATNVATNYKTFSITSYPYNYLAVQYTGSGTMSAIFKGYAIFKRGKQ